MLPSLFMKLYWVIPFNETMQGAWMIWVASTGLDSGAYITIRENSPNLMSLSQASCLCIGGFSGLKANYMACPKNALYFPASLVSQDKGQGERLCTCRAVWRWIWCIPCTGMCIFHISRKTLPCTFPLFNWDFPNPCSKGIQHRITCYLRHWNGLYKKHFSTCGGVFLDAM